MSETFEPVDFSSVHEGDTVSFNRRDNGFGGSGDIARRTGTVIKVTDKTVTVECDDIWGKTGVLRRADWRERVVAKAVTEKPARRPYDAKNVQYVDQGNIVTAVWCSDPTVDPATALDNSLRSITGDVPYEVEVIAEATRFYRTEGAGFSGWIISSGSNYSTVPIKRKPDALTELRGWVDGYFTRDQGARN